MQQNSSVAARTETLAHVTRKEPPLKMVAYSPQIDESDVRSSQNRSSKQTRVKRTLQIETSTLEYMLVKVYAQKTTRSITSKEIEGSIWGYDQDQQETETTYTLYPASWLIRFGLHYGLRLRSLLSSTNPWKTTLEPIRPVPDDALIFDLCRTGNVAAVQQLLSRGEASIRDVDSQGYTPLHVSTMTVVIPM